MNKTNEFFQIGREKKNERKAILVIDMPSCCNVCTFNNAIGECKFVGYVDEALSRSLRYVGCPLKPMPEKREKPTDNSYDFGFAKEIDGYNICIDEITGEEE